MKADVPRDQRPHVIKASAPGYEAFKKVISFANDVYLEIELKRKTGSVRWGAKSHASEPLPNETSKTETAPAMKQTEEAGMTLGHPKAKRPAKKGIDEKDPYVP